MIIQVSMSYPTRAYYPTIDKDRDLAQHWILQLANPERREDALYELVKMREYMAELAPMLWFSFGTTAVLVHELIETYPVINPPALTTRQSNRICNALALFQCMAAHQVTRPPFMSAEIVMFMLPLLKSTMTTQPFEYLRLTTLGVIGALIKSDEDGILNFFLGTDIVPLCLKVMEIGLDLSKTVAIYIIQRLLSRDNGLAYMCETHDRFMHVCMVLGKMVIGLVKTPCTRTLKLVALCYLRLSEDLRAREALRFCLPHQLRNSTFAEAHLEDPVIKHSVLQLIRNLNTGPFYTLPPVEQNSFDSSDNIMPSARKSRNTSNVQSELNDSESESNTSEEILEQQTSEQTRPSGRYFYSNRPRSPLLPLNLQGVPSYEPPMNIMYPHVMPGMPLSNHVQPNTFFPRVVPPPLPPGENIYTHDTIYPYPTFHLQGLSKYVLPPDIPQDTDFTSSSCAKSSSQDKSETSSECQNFNSSLPSPSTEVASHLSSSPDLKLNLSNPPPPILYRPPTMLNQQKKPDGEQPRPSSRIQIQSELYRPPIMSTHQQESRYRLSPRLDQPKELFPNHILHTTNVCPVSKKWNTSEQTQLSTIPEDTPQLLNNGTLQKSPPVQLPSMKYPPPVIHNSLNRPPPSMSHLLQPSMQMSNGPMCPTHAQQHPPSQHVPRYLPPVQYTSSPNIRIQNDLMSRTPPQQPTTIQQASSQEHLLMCTPPPPPIQHTLLRHSSTQPHILMRNPNSQQQPIVRNISPQQQAQMQQLPQQQISAPQPHSTVQNISPHQESPTQTVTTQENSISQNASPHLVSTTHTSPPPTAVKNVSPKKITILQPSSQQRLTVRNVSPQHSSARPLSPQQSSSARLSNSPRRSTAHNVSPQKQSMVNHVSPQHSKIHLPSPKYQSKQKSSVQYETQISRSAMVLNHLQGIQSKPPQRLYPEHGPNPISCSQEQVSSRAPTTTNNQVKANRATSVTISNGPVSLNPSIVRPVVTPEVLPLSTKEKTKTVAKKSLANIVNTMSQLGKQQNQNQNPNSMKKQTNQHDENNKLTGKHDSTGNDIYRQVNGLTPKKSNIIHISPRQKLDRPAPNQTLHTKYSQGRSQTNLNSSRQWTNHTNSLTNNQGQNRLNNNRPQSSSNQNRQWNNHSSQNQNGRNSNRSNSGKALQSNQSKGKASSHTNLNHQKGEENILHGHKNRHNHMDKMNKMDKMDKMNQNGQNGLSTKSYKENIVTQVEQSISCLAEQTNLNNQTEAGWQAVGRAGSINHGRRQNRCNNNNNSQQSHRSRTAVSRSQPCTSRATR